MVAVDVGDGRIQPGPRVQSVQSEPGANKMGIGNVDELLGFMAQASGGTGAWAGDLAAATLAQPEGPTRVRNSPAKTSSETSRSADAPPKLFETAAISTPAMKRPGPSPTAYRRPAAIPSERRLNGGGYSPMTECSLGNLNCWLQQTLFTPWRGARRRQGAPERRCGRSVARVLRTVASAQARAARLARTSAAPRPAAVAAQQKRWRGRPPGGYFAATVRNSAVPA